jgi:hypothetical protein
MCEGYISLVLVAGLQFASDHENGLGWGTMPVVDRSIAYLVLRRAVPAVSHDAARFLASRLGNVCQSVLSVRLFWCGGQSVFSMLRSLLLCAGGRLPGRGRRFHLGRRSYVA